MALPNSIDASTPAGSTSPSLGDDRIRELKTAVQDLLGIPDATAISQAGFDFDAGGLAQAIFYDPAVTPASGELGRNGSTLYYRITDARTNTTTRPLGLIADTSGSAAASIGVGMLFQAESADEAPSDFGALDFVATDVTAASEDTYASIALRVAGNALDEKYRFSSTAGSGFAALFTHGVTADRTYTLPDVTGTLGFQPAAEAVQRTAGDLTTTSATLADLTGMTITKTVKVGRVLLVLTGTANVSDINQYGVFNLMADGVLLNGTVGWRFQGRANSFDQFFHVSAMATIATAGSYIFKAQFAVDGGVTLTVQADSALPLNFYIVELPGAA